MQELYRLATTEELTFYRQVLYPLQDEIFRIAGVYDDKIYLTGGTALARFYLQHRLSEALDFFTTTDDLKLIVNDLESRLQNHGFGLELERLKRIPVAYEHLLTINVTGISGRALLTQPVPAEDLTTFVEDLKRRTEAEVKKKEQLAAEQIDGLIERLLWDFPRGERRVNRHSLPVLQRRLKQLPLPAGNALQKVL